jgi:hypothetical protein
MRFGFETKALEGLVLALVISLFATQSGANDWYSIEDGELKRPTGYREWVHVGTPPAA